MIVQEEIHYTEEEAKAIIRQNEELRKKYNSALEKARELMNKGYDVLMPEIFPELQESEDEKVRKALISILKSDFGKGTTIFGISVEQIIDWLEKQRKQQDISALEAWKDMRLEVYQQASGNRHEPNYSDDSTKMFSLNDIDEIIEKISEQKSDDKIEPKSLNADKVIEWLKGTIRETKEYLGEYGEYYDIHLTLPYDSVEDLINDFKEDFGL